MPIVRIIMMMFNSLLACIQVAIRIIAISKKQILRKILTFLLPVEMIETLRNPRRSIKEKVRGPSS